MKYIYALVDPRDDTIRYVGETADPEKRLMRHIMRSKTACMREWIGELRAVDKAPRMRIVEVLDYEYSIIAEQHWIHHYLDLGANLLNTSFRKSYRLYTPLPLSYKYKDIISPKEGQIQRRKDAKAAFQVMYEQYARKYIERVEKLKGLLEYERKSTEA